MVDCVYYEEQNIDKSKTIDLLESYFGKNFKYDFNDSQRTGAAPYFLEEKDVLNPNKETYIALKKAVKALEWTSYKLNGAFLHYNSLLMILAAITDCIPVSTMEEWESDPRIAIINN